MTTNSIAPNPELPGPFCLVPEEVSDAGYQCTRATGHPGSHMASGGGLYAIWDEQLAWVTRLGVARWYTNTANGWIAA